MYMRRLARALVRTHGAGRPGRGYWGEAVMVLASATRLVRLSP